MLSKEDVIAVNKKFANGNIVNNSSLGFALSMTKTTKDWIKQLAFLVRAIVIDHVFEEGNKRTASSLVIAYIETHKLGYDPKGVDDMIVKILKKNVSSITKIRRMIKDATW